LESKENEGKIDITVQALGIINCYIDDYEPARDFLKKSPILFDSISRLLKLHSDLYKIQDISLRVIRNLLSHQLISIDTFLQVFFPNKRIQ